MYRWIPNTDSHISPPSLFNQATMLNVSIHWPIILSVFNQQIMVNRSILLEQSIE